MQGPLKIIHIVENLDKGAVENWLVKTFIESRKMYPNWQWTFYCILGKEGRLDEKVKAAGGEIIYSPVWISKKFHFLQALRRQLKKGRYDIIHSHHDYLSGFYLLAAAGISFKKRILHIHNTDKVVPVGNERLQKLLLPFFRKSALHFSDLLVGISNDTLRQFAGPIPLKKPASCVLYYGVDLKPYAPKIARDESFFRELQIPAHARVLLFVGRMNTLKNPVFVVDILAVLNKTRKDIYAIFIGEGDKATVLQRAHECNVEDKVRLAGWRNDTAAIMQQADVFVFPRMEYPKEGLGLVVVEAQAAGLPMMISNGIVEDAIEIPELAHVISLNNNPGEWAVLVCKILDEPAAMDRARAYHLMQESRFELGNATRNFLTLYETEFNKN